MVFGSVNVAPSSRVSAAVTPCAVSDKDANAEISAGRGGKGAAPPPRRLPCVKRPVHPGVHCCSTMCHFVTPFFTSFWVIRFWTAGFVDPITEVVLTTVISATILCCCGVGCCRLPHCIGLWLGICCCALWIPAFILNKGEMIHIDGHFNATRRVAVVGGGPSGVTAAWTLALENPHAQVDLYEANERFGGHSDTVMVDGQPIDIGFIFSTPDYAYYNALCDRHKVARKNASISVHYHGSATHAPWQNTAGGMERFAAAAGAERAAKLRDDIERFNAATSSEKTLVDILMPLGWWLWLNGFGDDFFHSALVPMLTPLFVTQHGNEAQSAGATLNHFAPASGFLSFNASSPASPEVHHTVGGVQFMYERMVEEARRKTPGFRARPSSPVAAVAPSANGWRVTTAVGASEEYDEVILACNAHIAERMLAAGGDGEVGQWPSCSADQPGRAACSRWYSGLFRALRAWAMRATYFEPAEVTLSRSAPDDVVRGDSLYHIFDGGVMAGSIDRILHVSSTGELRLRVAAPNHHHVAPDTSEPIASRVWEHHHFNLWEHLVVLRVLPHFNNFDGLHVAGDWTQSVGQDAAVRSGVRAACAVGLSNATKAALGAIGLHPAMVNAC